MPPKTRRSFLSGSAASFAKTLPLLSITKEQKVSTPRSFWARAAAGRMAEDDQAPPGDFVKGSSDAARTRIIYVSIGLIFALLVASYLVYQIAVAVLVLLLTMLFSVIISAPVDYLEHRGMSRGLGTLVVFGGLVLGIWIAGVALAPTIADQAVQLWETFPELLENA